MAALLSQHEPKTNFYIPLPIISSAENYKQLHIIFTRKGQEPRMSTSKTVESLFPDTRVRRAGKTFSLPLKGMYTHCLDLWGLHKAMKKRLRKEVMQAKTLSNYLTSTIVRSHLSSSALS